MPDPDLLPCPFCGHSAAFFEMKSWSLYINCVECDAEMNVTGDSRKTAAAKWNARVACDHQQVKEEG